MQARWLSDEEIAKPGDGLTLVDYACAEEAEDEDEPFAQKMKRLTIKLDKQPAASAILGKSIRENLKGLGYGK